MLYEITAKGRKQVGWRSITQRITTSFPEDDVLRYLKKRKTPATAEEICRGVNYSKGMVSGILSPLMRKGFVKKL